MTRGRTCRLATALSVVFVAGCGAASTSPSATPKLATTTASPTPTPSPTPSPASAGPLIVTSDGSTVSLLTTDGTVVATAPEHRPWQGIESEVIVGSEAVYLLNGTTIANAAIQRLDPDGTVTTVATLPPIPTRVDGINPDFSFAVSPDGSQVAIGGLVAVSSTTSQVTFEPSSYTSELWLSTNGSTPVSVFKQTGTAGNLLPFAWTLAQGIYAAEVPWGIGGAGPFLAYSAAGAVTIDTSTWHTTPVGACELSDAGAVDALTGNTVCLLGGPSSGLFAVTVSGTTTKVQTAKHPYVGTFRVSDDGSHFAYGFCDGTFGEGTLTCGVAIVDVATGQAITTNAGPVTSSSQNSSSAAVDGWLPDGYLLITDSQGVESMAPDCTLQLLIADPTLDVVGILG